MIVVLAIALVGAFSVWLLWSIVSAKGSLEHVRAHVQAARVAITDGDVATARGEMIAAQGSASDARSELGRLPCRIVAAIPFVGAPIDAATGISNTVSAVADDVLPELLDAVSAIDLHKLRLPGGGLDLHMLESARGPLKHAAAAIVPVRDLAASIPDARYVSAIDDARQTLQDQVRQLDGFLTNGSIAAELVPPMLGGEGDRRYLVAFQTNAELRGTGGLVGGSALLTADGGRIVVDKVGSNRELTDADTGLDLGADFDHLYSTFQSNRRWQNSNISPHFPYAGRIWQNLIQQQQGFAIDGAAAVDPIALSYLLGATGPITLPGGEVVRADNVVELTESEVYARYPEDNVARKAFLTTIASGVLQKLASGNGSFVKILDAIGKGVGEGRIALWSTHPEEQALIEPTALGHAIPATAAPYANVTVNNSGGNKLDYYLRRELTYTARTCAGERRESKVSLKLTNTSPPNLPPYVSGVHSDLGLPSGSNLLIVNLYATKGSELKSLTINGEQFTDTVEKGMELGHPVFVVSVAMYPDDPVVLDFTLSEPTAGGEPQMPVQPLVVNGPATLAVPAC